MSAIVIIGTGLAGYTAAREFRKLDPATPLHLISRDDGSFYSKPILSNALALKKTPAQIALNTAADMERQLAATVSPHSAVTAIDTAAHHVSVDGTAIPYIKLVLAVGADPIRLSLAGDAADGVLSVNDLSDYARFRQVLDGKRRVVILGAGLIGCEFANDLRLGGYDVNVSISARNRSGDCCRRRPQAFCARRSKPPACAFSSAPACNRWRTWRRESPRRSPTARPSKPIWCCLPLACGRVSTSPVPPA